MYKTESFLTDINDAKEKQYLMLREAVWKHMEAQRNISRFTVTSIIAFYTIVFSININQPYIFLIPLIILLPFSYKELDHKIGISYIAAYQIVCLENNQNVVKSFTWETDSFLFKRKKKDDKSHFLFNKLIDCEFLLLGVISYGFFIFYFFKFTFNVDDFFCFKNLLGYFSMLFILVIILVIAKITKEYNLYVNSTEYYIKKWLKFMLIEKRIDLETYRLRFKELTGDDPTE